MAEDVHAQVRVPAEVLGFRQPPVECHLRGIHVRGVWVLYLWSRDADRDALTSWIRLHGRFTVRQARPAERILAVETDELPAPWVEIFDHFASSSVVVSEDGSALVTLVGRRDEVSAFVDELGDEAVVKQVTDPDGEPEADSEDPLTRKEREAMLAAFEAGYFSVPREVQLADVAEDMDRSTGSLSTLLRRGVERLVAAYAVHQLRGPALSVGSDLPQAESGKPTKTTSSEGG
jgi:hypothetical protein